MAWWIKNRGKVFLRNHQWRRNLSAWCPFQLKLNIKFIIALTRESLFLLFDWLNVWGHQNCERVMKYCFLQFIAGGCPQSVKTCFKIPLIQLNCSVFHIQLVYRKTTCLCPHNRTFPAPKKQTKQNALGSQDFLKRCFLDVKYKKSSFILHEKLRIDLAPLLGKFWFWKPENVLSFLTRRQSYFGTVVPTLQSEKHYIRK